MIRLRKDLKIEAIQFKNTEESIRKINELLPCFDKSINYKNNSEPFMVIGQKGDKQKINIGDWIVSFYFDDDVNISNLIMKDEQFNKYLEIVL